METTVNSKNALAEIYYSLSKAQRVLFRKRMSELFEWDSEKTFYRKMKDYKPTPVEKLTAEMVYDEITA